MLGSTIVKYDIVSLLHAIGRDLVALGHAVVCTYFSSQYLDNKRICREKTF